MIGKIENHIKTIDLDLLASKECFINMTLQQYWKQTENKEVPVRDTWETFYAALGTCDLYRDEKMIQNLLDDLNKLDIKHVETMEGGTQVRFPSVVMFFL